MKKLLLAAALLAAPATAFAAADFAAVDADKSGAVSMEEAKAALPDLTEEAFKAADKDGSGDLNAEEFAAIAG